MKLRMFSVLGEALNFGLRRMETIMRVAWLPVVLTLIFNMASVFAVLSVANNRLITFADLARGIPYQKAIEISAQALEKGLLTGSVPMWTVYGVTIFVSTILISSFMAPLIRFAGLGERPSPGIVKLAFGPDQIRYILATLIGLFVTIMLVYAPIGFAALWVLQYIIDALSQTFVSFPNPESLHTIELVSAREVLAARGELWYHLLGVPIAVAGGFAAVFWVILVGHFAPKNRGGEPGSGNILARAIVVLIVLGGIVALLALGLQDKENQAATSLSALIAIGLLIALYFSLRVFPFAGIAVCRKSLAPAGLFRVTRGWNIIRVLVVLILTATTIGVVQYVVNAFLLGAFGPVLSTLFSATLTATKLTHSGEASPWVLPFFIWIWNLTKILVNIFLLFFSYGVMAGLQGRLYRESERTEA